MQDGVMQHYPDSQDRITMQGGGNEVLEVTLAKSSQTGMASFEIQTGCLLSEPLHVLVCPTAALAAELMAIPQSAGLQGIIGDLGLLLSPADHTCAAVHKDVALRCLSRDAKPLL